MIAAGKQVAEKAEDSMKQAQVSIHKADHAHHQADWLDLSHLAVELGLVLCSLTLLKKRGFLMAGVVAAAIGIGLAGYGILLPEHAPDTHSSSQTDKPH